MFGFNTIKSFVREHLNRNDDDDFDYIEPSDNETDRTTAERRLAFHERMVDMNEEEYERLYQIAHERIRLEAVAFRLKQAGI